MILAGGLATRYDGRPKGLEPVGGRRVIDRVADALSAAGDDLLLVANAPDAGGWLPGVRTLPDVRPGEGSLGGIHAALAHAGTDVLLVAWDMPFVSAGLLRALRERSAEADAVLPRSDSKRGMEPLCAFYGAACLPAIERRLDAGDRRVISFFSEVRVAHLDEAEVRRHGDPARLFLNINTPHDLELAERHAASPDAGDRRSQA